MLEVMNAQPLVAINNHMRNEDDVYVEAYVNRVRNIRNEKVPAVYLADVLREEFTQWNDAMVEKVLTEIVDNSVCTLVKYSDLFDVDNDTVAMRYYHVESVDDLQDYVKSVVDGNPEYTASITQDWLSDEIHIVRKGVCISTKPYELDAVWSKIGLTDGVSKMVVSGTAPSIPMKFLSEQLKYGTKVNSTAFMGIVGEINWSLMSAYLTGGSDEIFGSLKVPTGPEVKMYRAVMLDSDTTMGFNDTEELAAHLCIKEMDVFEALPEPDTFYAWYSKKIVVAKKTFLNKETTTVAKKQQKPKKRKSVDGRKFSRNIMTALRLSELRQKLFFVGGSCLNGIDAKGVPIAPEECTYILKANNTWVGKVFVFFITKDGSKDYVCEDFVVEDRIPIAELQEASDTVFNTLLDDLYEQVKDIKFVSYGQLLAPSKHRSLDHLEKSVVDHLVKNRIYDHDVCHLANSTKNINQIGSVPQVVAVDTDDRIQYI